ncbi:hypothetical protein PSQ20_07725 [Curvibacter sp. RS43]|uniref:hypothetical protein n=1 Tax=Curvibacter microcysteis TaxID=3026419 RepID=UPI002361CD81|nr:hypothetical protein [Curvibacter sp. RS43]MDD0810218.1 hypothetical protein [Curvibacter sp. RS43]
MKLGFLIVWCPLFLMACSTDDNGRLRADIDRIQAGVYSHQSLPSGVPKSYDWYESGRPGVPLDLAGYTALTGWGQVFQENSADSDAPYVQVKKIRTYLHDCSAERWLLVQDSGVDGANFRADFANNANWASDKFNSGDGLVSRVDFNSAFHFWPRSKRFDISGFKVCGVVVAVRARSVICDDRHLCRGGGQGNLLIGLGADYWVDVLREWGAGANKDIFVGRLVLLESNFRWYFDGVGDVGNFPYLF